MSAGKVAVGGGLGTVLLLIIALIFGADPRQLLEQLPTEPSSQVQSSRPLNPEEEELKQFVSVVLAKSEDVWNNLFQQNGRQYREPTLVLFTDQVQSACGRAGAAVGPFYCPGDEKVYIDLSFYEELRRRFAAPGDFAQAYVIAHEVGHHVQHLLGISDRVDAMRGRVSQSEANQLSVRLELQADFFAGVFARYVRDQGVLEPGDIEEALRCANAIALSRLRSPMGSTRNSRATLTLHGPSRHRPSETVEQPAQIAALLRAAAGFGAAAADLVQQVAVLLEVLDAVGAEMAGVPIGMKDLFATQGVQTTAGVPTGSATIPAWWSWRISANTSQR